MDSISQNNGGEIRKLCRFTNISILLDILNRKKLFMPNYNSWDNKIDTDILDYYLYKMNKKHGTVELRALCFSHGDESIHHWNCYSNDMTGCCIEFDYNSLLQ